MISPYSFKSRIEKLTLVSKTFFLYHNYRHQFNPRTHSYLHTLTSQMVECAFTHKFHGHCLVTHICGQIERNETPRCPRYAECKYTFQRGEVKDFVFAEANDLQTPSDRRRHLLDILKRFFDTSKTQVCACARRGGTDNRHTRSHTQINAFPC